VELKDGAVTGECDLRTLLRHMTPLLHPGTFVFCSFPGDDLPAGLTPIATFRENEGISAVVTLDEAQRAGMPYQFESGLITLTIHSSLDAVGFLAAVSAVLADAGIPCNAVVRLSPRPPLRASAHGAAGAGSPGGGGRCASAESRPESAAAELKVPRPHQRREQQHQPERPGETVE
jgi:hypothetical protein